MAKKKESNLPVETSKVDATTVEVSHNGRNPNGVADGNADVFVPTMPSESRMSAEQLLTMGPVDAKNDDWLMRSPLTRNEIISIVKIAALEAAIDKGATPWGGLIRSYATARAGENGLARQQFLEGLIGEARSRNPMMGFFSNVVDKARGVLGGGKDAAR